MAQQKRTGDWDLLAQWLFVGCLVLAGLTVIIGILSPVLGPTLTAIAGLFAFLGWIWLGAPAHLALLLYTLVRTFQGDGRRFMIVWAYLASVLICALLVLLAMGLGGPLTEIGHEVTRRFTDSAQVRLEAGIRERGLDAEEDVRTALAAGADPDGSLLEMPLLVHAAMRGDLAKVHMLLAAGADPNLAAPAGMSDLWISLRPWHPLEAAIVQAHPDRDAMLQALLDAGADPTLSPLRVIACAHNDADLYRRLAELPAGPEADAEGTTCLHLIAERGFADMLALVATEFSDPNLRDNNGLRPLDQALRHGHDEVALALLTMGGRAGQSRRVERTLARTDTDARFLELKAALEALP